MAMLAAAKVPFRIKFGGSVLLTYARDCARAFILAAQAAAGSGQAVSLNVPGRPIGVAALVDLIEAAAPESVGRITRESTPLEMPALITAPALEALLGPVPNCPLSEGVEATISHFRNPLAAGLLTPPASEALREFRYKALPIRRVTPLLEDPLTVARVCRAPAKSFMNPRASIADQFFTRL